MDFVVKMRENSDAMRGMLRLRACRPQSAVVAFYVVSATTRPAGRPNDLLAGCFYKSAALRLLLGFEFRTDHSAEKSVGKLSKWT